MNCYLISYDLRSPGKNYEDLIKQITGYGIYAKICESLWAIETSKTAQEVRDHLRRHIDGNDRLFVLKSGREAAWFNVLCRNERLIDHS